MIGGRVGVVCGVVVAAGLVGARPAAAEDKGPFPVRAGVATKLVSYASYSPETCYFGPLPRMRVLQPPAHGAVEIVKDSFVAKDGRCQGKTFKSMGVVYRSAAGFRGRDTMTIESITEVYVDGMPLRTNTSTITVDVK